MTPAPTWRDVKVFDAESRELGVCRVPLDPIPPPVIMWGHRHFRYLAGINCYREVKVYAVPLENMYAGARVAPPPPLPKGEK